VPKKDLEFERLILPHLDAAYNVARWLAADAAAADDIVQEAMLRALRFHQGLRGDAKPWLLRIVRNVFYARVEARRQAREVPLDGLDPDGVPHEPRNPETYLDQTERSQALNTALAALPEDLRECLVLRELEEMTYKEIADIVGVPIGTVMSRLFRARQLMMGAAT
jgi:RNA polymerase sigma-70 factor (ECF subfamily)